MSDDAEKRIEDIIRAAEPFSLDDDRSADADKPRLHYEPNNPDRSVERLRDVIAQNSVAHFRS